LMGTKPLKTPEDLTRHTLLHDTSRRDWKAWFKQLDIQAANVNQGPIFSHSSMVIQAAIHGQGVALGHSVLTQPEIDAGRLVCPFEQVLMSKNAYYLVCHESQAALGKIAAFREWMLALVVKEEQQKALNG
ncbi:MAG: LysR substrate-binding domain-containing protein, partial [Oceanisphaera sp.]|nr:LysR substrate-binding domain-containing protein [Oceanisphaera sp.]